jgi:amino acid adenylation domain-containing protein
MGTTDDLLSGFLRSVERHGERSCVSLGGGTLTYEGLHRRASAVAASLVREDPDPDPPLAAVLAGRSPVRFSGVLGALLAGRGYLPLDPGSPPGRTRGVLRATDCRAVVTDGDSVDALEAVLEGLSPPLVVLLPDVDDVAPLAARHPEHRFVGRRDLDAPADPRAGPARPDDVAYLMFTSGSTGRPKGVPVTHGNVRHFLDAVAGRLGLGPDDRLSHTFDLTFDLSVFDLFAAWDAGACVHCPSRGDLLAPGRYLREERLTVWFSVPSLGVLMRRLGLLEPDAYPDLRLVLFCGAPLTADLARAWRRAAPSAALENLYGPTELTVACTGYRWDDATSPAECENGLVPIGRPFPGLRALVLAEDGREAAPGEEGELLIAGPQRTPGYWKDEAATAAAHRIPPDRVAVHYHTGDLARRPFRAEGPIRFLGRRDQQVKVRGFRVELGEVEAALREAAGADEAVALGWPRTQEGVEALVGFVAGGEIDPSRVRAALRGRLPAYMIPRTIRVVPELPRNRSGKLDRKALLDLLESEKAR